MVLANMLNGFSNKVTVVRVPDWNGGYYPVLVPAPSHMVELDEFEYIEFEGTVEALFRSTFVEHREPFHEEARDYTVTGVDLAKIYLGW